MNNLSPRSGNHFQGISAFNDSGAPDSVPRYPALCTICHSNVSEHISPCSLFDRIWARIFPPLRVPRRHLVGRETYLDWHTSAGCGCCQPWLGFPMDAPVGARGARARLVWCLERGRQREGMKRRPFASNRGVVKGTGDLFQKHRWQIWIFWMADIDLKSGVVDGRYNAEIHFT